MLTKSIKIALAGMLAMSAAVPLALPVQADGGDDPLGLGQGMTPAGRWVSETGDSKYDVSLCGDDGTALCGKLVWIRPRDRNKRNVKFLDQWVVYEAARTRPAQWEGTLNVYGTDYAGKVNMLSYDQLKLTACAYVLLCESQVYTRTQNPDGSGV